MSKADEYEQCDQPDIDDFDYDGEDCNYNDDDDLDEALSNCGQISGGGCMYAGTEFCDWECPFSNGMYEILIEE